MLPGLDGRPDLVGLKAVYVEAARSAFFVSLDEQGEVIGTAALRPYDDRLPDMRGVYDPGHTAEVWRCYVRSDQRGRGVGTALLRQLSDFAREAGFSTLCLPTCPAGCRSGCIRASGCVWNARPVRKTAISVWCTWTGWRSFAFFCGDREGAGSVAATIYPPEP